jgi:hypothetical protein
MHDFFVRYFMKYVYPDIDTWLRATFPDFESVPITNPTLPLLFVKASSQAHHIINKEPDAGVRIWRSGTAYRSIYPRIIVEVAYSESWEHVVEKAGLWLWGSLGEVRCAILVKMNCPPEDFDDATKWEAYLEIHVRSSESK